MQDKSKLAKILTASVLILTGLTLTGCDILAQDQKYRATAQSIQTLEQGLTAIHGNEAWSAIENYQRKVNGLDTLHDQGQYGGIATGRYLQELTNIPTPQPDEWKPIFKSIALNEVHVLEFSSAQFKAIGCGLLYF